MDKLKMFKALSDPNRLAIAELLASGEKCACVLLEKLACGQPTLSHHMKVLCDAGIVKCRREGKWTHYHLDRTALQELEDYIKQLDALPATAANPACCIRKSS